jgi:hypothetical protein
MTPFGREKSNHNVSDQHCGSLSSNLHQCGFSDPHPGFVSSHGKLNFYIYFFLFSQFCIFLSLKKIRMTYGAEKVLNIGPKVGTVRSVPTQKLLADSCGPETVTLPKGPIRMQIRDQ